MKLAAFFMASSILSAIDPGCGAGVGSNTANGDGGAITVDGGALATMDCKGLGTHFFCDDFAGGALPSAFATQGTSAGKLELLPTAGNDGSPALVASTLRVENATRTFARLEKRFSPSGKRFSLSYSEWVDAECVGPSDAVETAAIGLGTNYWVGVRRGTPDHVLETSLKNGLYIQGHNLKTSMPRGAWTKITLAVDAERNTMALSVNGEVVVQGEPLEYPLDGDQVPMIAVGVLTDNLTFKPAACQVKIDDVAFDVER